MASLNDNKFVPKIKQEAGSAALGAVFLIVAVILQNMAHAYTAEFLSDSSSHYLSGLAIYDYLNAGKLTNPVKYIIAYHSHYPLIGIGGWPPFYYCVEAAWMLIFSTSRASILGLSAVVTAVTALVIHRQGVRAAGVAGGIFVGATFVLSPVVQEGSSDLMLDVPVALVMLLATIAFAHFMQRGEGRASILFAVLAVVALLIKGNAGALVLVPPLALVFSQRLALLRKFTFWLPVPIVMIGAGPWYLMTHHRTESGFQFSPGLEYAATAFRFNASALIDALGPIVFGIAVVGLIRAVFDRRQPADAWVTCAAALALSVFIFLLVIPVALQARYLIPAIPPLLLLAIFEIGRWYRWLVSRWGDTGPWRIVLTTFCALILVSSVFVQAAELPQTRHTGITEAARQIWRIRIPKNPAVLVATDATSEASAIAALAMLDPHRPSLFVVRGSRLLGEGGYNNADYRPRYLSSDEVGIAIDRYKIPLVLLRDPISSTVWRHVRQVEQVAQTNPERWRLVYFDGRALSGIQLFRIAGNAEATADKNALTTLSAPNALRVKRGGPKESR